MIDWSKYARHELRLKEVQKMVGETAPRWTWIDAEGSEMYVGGNDDFIAMRFMLGHSYESVTRALWRKVCAGATLVADIGTHSGIFTLDAFLAGAKNVLSVEPHPINYSRLVLNIRRNGFACTGAFFGALGDENKTEVLLVKQMYLVHAAGRVGLHNVNGTEFPVRVARLDSLLDEKMWPALKAIKIDAENYTPHVIRGMEKLFISGARPDMIIECTEPGLGERLKMLGYRFWRIWETGKIEEVEDLTPHNPDNNYNGTDEDCRNRFASMRGLSDGA